MKKEIVFSIDPSSRKSLIVQIFEVAAGQWRPFLGEESSVKMLIEERNRQARRMERRSLEDASRIPIEAKRSIPVLKVLAATGKLYFGRQPLICNFFSGVELRYTYEEGFLRGKIVTPHQEYPLSECDFISQGDPPWLIYRGCLQVLKGDVSWKWMRRVYEEQPLRLTDEEAERFFDEVGPSCVEGGRKERRIPDPLPVLLLTDQRGVFANLWMNYEGRLIQFEEHIEKGRNREAELGWKKDLLDAGYLEKQVGSSHFYCPMNRVADALFLLLEIGWEVKDCRGNQLIPQGKVDLSLHSETHTLLAKGTVSFGDHQASLSAVAQAVREGGPFIPLKPGLSGLLSNRFFDANLAGLFEGEQCVEGIRIRRHDLGLLQGVFESKIEVNLDQQLQQMRDRLRGESLPQVTLGKGFQGSLREYQKEGVAWLSFLYENGLNGILADDMGLGKTVQVLAFLSTLEIVEPVLIVMPKTVLFHWKNEFAAFLPHLKIFVHHGSDRAESEEDWKGVHAILTSYATLRRDSEWLQKIHFSALILDEAQAIKNWTAQITKAVCGLDAPFRLSITGTPIENHLGELLSQFRFLMPGLFDEESPDPVLIKKKARPFILRRKKGEVEEQLPEKIEQVIWLEMEETQKAAYEAYLAGIKQGVLKKVTIEGMGQHRMEVFEAILRLRQLCCHPLLVGADFPSIKSEALLLDLETVVQEGRKALVYSQFTSMLKLIAKACREKGWKYAYLDGETKDRERVVHQFQNDQEVQLFLISLKAGGVGLTLTAADYVLLYDPWWNEAVENQAIDRAHRIGRRDPVIAKRYVIKNTIEERMMQLKLSKLALSDDLFDSGQGFNDDDLEFLFQGVYIPK